MAEETDPATAEAAAGAAPAAAKRGAADSYAELCPNVINPSHPLFTSQYGLTWPGLQNLHDADGIDLWSNAKDAALLNRAYCRELAAKKFRTYDAPNGGWWGLSAGDGPHGYVAPGPVETPMLFDNTPAEIEAERQTVLIGRFLQPDEIAATIAFLVGPGGDGYVGQVLSPNGGTVFPG